MCEITREEEGITETQGDVVSHRVPLPWNLRRLAGTFPAQCSTYGSPMLVLTFSLGFGPNIKGLWGMTVSG